MDTETEKFSFGPYDPGTLRQIVAVLEECDIEVRIQESSDDLEKARRQPSAMTGPHMVSYLYVFLTANELGVLGGRLGDFGIMRDESESEEDGKR